MGDKELRFGKCAKFQNQWLNHAHLKLMADNRKRSRMAPLTKGVGMRPNCRQQPKKRGSQETPKGTGWGEGHEQPPQGKKYSRYI